MRIEREREILKTGKSSIEVTWSLTSLGTDRAGPEELLALVRNHWHIENRLHYVPFNPRLTSDPTTKTCSPGVCRAAASLAYRPEHARFLPLISLPASPACAVDASRPFSALFTL